jgi:hypothetical protein
LARQSLWRDEKNVQIFFVGKPVGKEACRIHIRRWKIATKICVNKKHTAKMLHKIK